MNHFFTSDYHEWHRNILKYSHRLDYLTDEEKKLLEEKADFEVSWDSVKRMNQALIDNTNAIVGEDDVLWFGGDFIMGVPHDKVLDLAWGIRKQIKCKTIHCIWGNHDKHRISPIFTTTNDLLLISIAQDGSYKMGDEAQHKGERFVLSHYAMAIWNGWHKGVRNLYAHSHSGAEKMMDEKFPDRKSMDIGVDNAKKLVGEYRPFTLKEVLCFTKDKK